MRLKGAKMPDNQTTKKTDRTPLIIVGVIIACVVAWPQYQKWSEHQNAKALVLASLKDPASAQFRNLRKNFNGVCGEVNAKNAFGGYTGFKTFEVAADGKVFMEQDAVGLEKKEIEQLNAMIRVSCN